jgi:hypothetical protein
MNLFPPTEQQFYNRANEWNMAGVFTVAGHGSFRNMSDQNKHTVWAHELAKMIRANPNFKGQRIVLGSCNTARKTPNPDEPNFAQRLADYLGVPVTASTDFIYPTNGDLMRIPVSGTGGNWVTVHPQADYKGPRF